MLGKANIFLYCKWGKSLKPLTWSRFARAEGNCRHSPVAQWSYFWLLPKISQEPEGTGNLGSVRKYIQETTPRPSPPLPSSDMTCKHPIYLTGDILHSVGVIRLLTSSAKLLKVNLWWERKHLKHSPLAPVSKRHRFHGTSHLVGALHTPHVGTFPPDFAVLAVIIAILLL